MNTAIKSTYFRPDSRYVTALSFIPEKRIQPDKTISTAMIPTTFFLNNDKWHISFFVGIEQLEEAARVYQKVRDVHNIYFNLNNPSMNTELKFIVHQKLFSEEWSIRPLYENYTRHFKKYALFINEKYPFLDSLLDIDIDIANDQWLKWLQEQAIPTEQKHMNYATGKSFLKQTQVAGFLKCAYKYLGQMTDDRNEWDKDVWDARRLKRYGVDYEKSRSASYVHFERINNEHFKRQYKKYVKEKLIAGSNYTWGTAVNLLPCISRFLNFISDREPEWKTLRFLERSYIEEYIEVLNQRAAENPTKRISNPKKYVRRELTMIERFLTELQIREYEMAPQKNVKSLIFPYDKPAVVKKPYDHVDHVPDFVLEQVFAKIDCFDKSATPIIWIMYKTGLRICDVLSLKQNCLLKIGGEYWIESDIRKTYVQGHRLPIDNELASLLSVLIAHSIERSNEENNPDKYIFVRYKGQRKGKPYSQNWIRHRMNAFAWKYDIRDEQERLYHFTNHSFRHTYAIKMLNSGVDIVTIQELLAHASPEMTLRYARILDNTKRKAFDKAMTQGVFSFRNDLLQSETDYDPQQIMDMLWINHKLNAVETPYGVCLQRINGNCQYAKRPPCLTCDAGFPCKDLCIGANDGDVQKYELLIQSTQSLIMNAQSCNRDDIAHDNEDLLRLYQDIYSRISSGNIIYSRLDRLIHPQKSKHSMKG